MNKQSIRNIFENTNGRTFSVVFKKKDGSIRKMTCRTGVKKHLKGGESTIKHKDNLFGVFDMSNGGYRCINLDTVISAKVDGVELKF